MFEEKALQTSHYGVMVLPMHHKESFFKSWLLNQNEETHNEIVETYMFYISVKLNWKSASSISRSFFKKNQKKISEIVLQRAKGYTGSGVLSDNDVQNNFSSTT